MGVRYQRRRHAAAGRAALLLPHRGWSLVSSRPLTSQPRRRSNRRRRRKQQVKNFVGHSLIWFPSAFILVTTIFASAVWCSRPMTTNWATGDTHPMGLSPSQHSLFTWPNPAQHAYQKILSSVMRRAVTRPSTQHARILFELASAVPKYSDSDTQRQRYIYQPRPRVKSSSSS
jgi:hypothetical protein